MPVTDQIADFITRIRNAGQAGHKTVEAPATKIKMGISEILKDQGFIQDFERVPGDAQDTIVVTLKYYKREPVIYKVDRVSKPGRRVYSTCEKLPRVNNGLGIAIVSTPKGVMTDIDARKQKVGGEIICKVF